MFCFVKHYTLQVKSSNSRNIVQNQCSGILILLMIKCLTKRFLVVFHESIRPGGWLMKLESSSVKMKSIFLCPITFGSLTFMLDDVVLV